MRKQWDDDDDTDETVSPANEIGDLDLFLEQGLITDVLFTVKSGKEATVYCCRAGKSTGRDLLAAKVYLSRNNRNFKNDSIYQEGRAILNQRTKRAVQKKTSFGRQAQSGMWLHHEWEALTVLKKVGADVPDVIARAENAILMEYVGDHTGAAPVLNSVALTDNEVKPAFDQIIRNIELWLQHNYIHADLSGFNILYWHGKMTIIDFPQAVDPRFNPQSLSLLTRDVENMCRYFARQGLETDAHRIANNLWRRFLNSQL